MNGYLGKRKMRNTQKVVNSDFFLKTFSIVRFFIYFWGGYILMGYINDCCNRCYILKDYIKDCCNHIDKYTCPRNNYSNT